MTTEPGRATITVPPDSPGPLRIGLISDTHIPEAQRELWPAVFAAFAGVDAILHGGDIHELRVLDQLSAIAPTWAARGNGEEGSAGRPIAPPDDRISGTWQITVSRAGSPDLRIGIIHDLPVPEFPPHLTVQRAVERHFGAQTLDVIIFGDTHVESIDLIGATVCINPGSPTYPHNLETQLGTIGFLELDFGAPAGAQIRASLCQLTEAGYDLVAARQFGYPFTSFKEAR